MGKTTRILFTVAFCLLLVSGVGCTRKRNRVRASGEVTVGGQPAKVGRITFTPVGLGSTYSAAISNGRYAIRSRSSVMAGEYTVRIETSSTGSSRGGYDRSYTDTVTLGGFAGKSHDFHLK
jgi:hypothetical protein